MGLKVGTRRDPARGDHGPGDGTRFAAFSPPYHEKHGPRRIR